MTGIRPSPSPGGHVTDSLTCGRPRTTDASAEVDLTFFAHLGEPAQWVTLPNDEGTAFTWLWMPARWHRIDATLEQVTRLTRAGWRPRPEPDMLSLTYFLCGQLADVRFMPQPEHATGQQLWARTDDVKRVRNMPVALAFASDRQPCESVDGVPLLHVEQALPPPQLGTLGVVLAVTKTADGVDIAFECYPVAALDARARTLQERLGAALEAIAAPVGWPTLVGDLDAPPSRERDLDVLRARHDPVTWLAQWQVIQKCAQQLAAAYWMAHQNAQRTVPGASSAPVLPPRTEKRCTRLPSADHFRAIAQSFGPGLQIQSDLWSDRSQPLRLHTPNGSTILVGGAGDEADANVVLYRYVADQRGPEGLKHLLVVLDAYDIQTSGHGQMMNARLILAQALLRMGYPEQRAYDREEQRKLLSTIFYLRHCSIESAVSPWAAEERADAAGHHLPRTRRRGGKGPRKWWTPLLVFEGIQYERDEEGNVQSLIIPTDVVFHLGKEYYNLLYGTQGRQYFAVPTALLLEYHAKNEQHELVLGFYLCNMLNMNGGRFTVSFRVLMEQSALRAAEALDRGNDRTRDAVRAIYALERLERDGFYMRAAQPDIDGVLAIELASGACSAGDLAPATLERIQTSRYYAGLRDAGPALQRGRRRKALQRLLIPGKECPKVTFIAGHLLREQAVKRLAQRQAAEAHDEDALTARVARRALAEVNEAIQHPETAPKWRRGRLRKGGTRAAAGGSGGTTGVSPDGGNHIT